MECSKCVLPAPLLPSTGTTSECVARIVAVEIDDAEQLLALAGKQLGDVVAGANLVVGIAGEVIAKGIAGAAQHFQRAILERLSGECGSHVKPPCEG